MIKYSKVTLLHALLFVLPILIALPVSGQQLLLNEVEIDPPSTISDAASTPN